MQLRGGRSGRVFINFEEQIEERYAWGFGNATNNQADHWALWQGLPLFMHWKTKKIVIVGDSLIAIHQFYVEPDKISSHSPSIQGHIVEQLKQLESYSFFHVLKGLNGKVDGMANLGVRLAQGTLELNEQHLSFISPP